MPSSIVLASSCLSISLFELSTLSWIGLLSVSLVFLDSGYLLDPCVDRCYAYRLLLTYTKSTYRLITILAVYKNGLGLSWDNPLCLLFILPCSLFTSQRF